jgi:hypothetical protein
MTRDMLQNTAVAQAFGPESIEHADTLLTPTGPSWQWRYGRNEDLDLFVNDVRADRTRDLDSRLAALNCGAELHRVIVRLAAAGWSAVVTRLPDRGDLTHLATVRIAPRPPATASAEHPVRAGVVSPSDGFPVGVPALAALAFAVERVGIGLCVLSAGQLYDLVAATVPRDGTGDRVPLAGGDVELPEQHTVFAVLYGLDDRLVTWMRAGEAFGAGRHAAADLRVSILPLIDAIEDADSRENVRRLLPVPGHPYLIVQVENLPVAAGAVPSSG